MAILSRAILVGQLHCLTDDGRIVITAQRWSDPQAPAGRPVSWLRLVRNGVTRQDMRFAGVTGQAEIEQAWAGFGVKYRPTVLTEQEMRSKLLELAWIEPSRCASSKCPGELPIAWPYCPVCGRDERHVAAGALSGVRRRGDIVVDRRKPSS